MGSDSTGTIMTCVVVAAGAKLIADQQNSELSMRPVLGAWLLGMILFIIATFDDDIAKTFAILVMVTSILMNGTKLFAAVGKVTGKPVITGPPLPSVSTRIAKGKINAV